MCNHSIHTRRRLLGMIAAAPLLAACKPQTSGPEVVRYNREVCEMCGMIISDPHFAAEVRGGPDARLAKFDDIGDAVHWLEMQPWKAETTVEFWVMNSENGQDWLDARTVYYRPGVVSPMDYGFAAVPGWSADVVDFAAMRQGCLDKGLTSRCITHPEAQG